MLLHFLGWAWGSLLEYFSPSLVFFFVKLNKSYLSVDRESWNPWPFIATPSRDRGYTCLPWFLSGMLLPLLLRLLFSLLLFSQASLKSKTHICQKSVHVGDGIQTKCTWWSWSHPPNHPQCSLLCKKNNEWDWIYRPTWYSESILCCISLKYWALLINFCLSFASYMAILHENLYIKQIGADLQ